MLIKICGVTHPEDARLAALFGAHFVGIVFDPRSKRNVSLGVAQEIAEQARRHGAEPVGVFVDQGAQEIQEVATGLNLNVVQLHGDRARAAYPELTGRYRCIVAGSLPITEQMRHGTQDFLLVDSSTPGSGKTFDWKKFNLSHDRATILAGGLSPENVEEAIASCRPIGVDVSSGVTGADGLRKDPEKMRAFIKKARRYAPPRQFNQFGGAFVPELLIPPLRELEEAFVFYTNDSRFDRELQEALLNYAGRPTALTETPTLAQRVGLGRVFLKREDLLHTGAHKLNNALGQVLLARAMGKTRVIAETGAGQHGVATATACARFGLECVVYMGACDCARQEINVKRMKLLGAKVVPVAHGEATLKEAVNEALRDWSSSFPTTAYCLGSALGPHPYPSIVRAFQTVIGRETREQINHLIGRLPDALVACVGGGSNAIGLFSAFLDDPVRLIGVEGGGRGDAPCDHAARFVSGSPGVLHGCYTYVLQDDQGQILPTHSISAGLDYPAVGPEHAALFEKKRAEFAVARDHEAVEALKLLATTEGIIAALESSHALAYLPRLAVELGPTGIVVVNLSGRGDKDLPHLWKEGLL